MSIPTEYSAQVNEVLSKLPNNPFVIDVIGKAIDVAYEHTEDPEDFECKLAVAAKVADYAVKTSPVNFFKYHLIAAALLVTISPEDYASLDTASGTIKKTATQLTEILDSPSWSDKWALTSKMARGDIDDLAVLLIILTSIIEGLNERAEARELEIPERYLLLGIAYLEVCLRKASFEITNDVYPIYNNFMALVLNNKFI